MCAQSLEEEKNSSSSSSNRTRCTFFFVFFAFVSFLSHHFEMVYFLFLTKVSRLLNHCLRHVFISRLNSMAFLAPSNQAMCVFPFDLHSAYFPFQFCHFLCMCICVLRVSFALHLFFSLFHHKFCKQTNSKQKLFLPLPNAHQKIMNALVCNSVTLTPIWTRFARLISGFAV